MNAKSPPSRKLPRWPLRPRSRGTIPELSGGLPLVGHMIDFVRGAVGLLERARNECGDVASFFVGKQQMVLLTGPKANEAFFRAPDKQLSPADAYAMMVPVFGKGVVYDATSERMGEQLRFLITALRDNRMRSYGGFIAKEVNESIEGWGDEGEVDLVDYMRVLTNFTSSRCLLGREFREEMTDEFAQLYHDMEQGITPLAYVNAHLPIPSFRKRDKARAKLVGMIGEIINKRRRSGDRGEDFLQTLMEAKYKNGQPPTEDEITGLLLAGMFAGHHTSSVTTAWALLELLHNPGAMQKARAEVDAVYADGGPVTHESLRELRYLEYAVKETLRLHPPLFVLMRGVREDFEVMGHVVPKGAYVLTSPTVSHRIPEVFPNPDRFEPERFAAPRSEDKKPFAYISFGGGRHRCTGNAFALLQVKTILAMLLRRYDFAPSGDGLESDFHGLVIGPKQPCRVRYRLRPESERNAAGKGQVARREAIDWGPEVRVTIDRDLCQGHGVCQGEAPELFRLDHEGVMEVLDEVPAKHLRHCLNEAVRHCPTGALKITPTAQDKAAGCPHSGD